MKIDTENTIYLVTNAENGEVHILAPKGKKIEIVQLKLDDPDHNGAHSKDKAVFELIKDEMEMDTFDI